MESLRFTVRPRTISVEGTLAGVAPIQSILPKGIGRRKPSRWIRSGSIPAWKNQDNVTHSFQNQALDVVL